MHAKQTGRNKPRARAKRPARRRARSANPPAPRGAIMLSRNVLSIAYQHIDDGKNYEHDFENDGVQLWLLPKGGLYIAHPTKPLWGEFEV